MITLWWPNFEKPAWNVDYLSASWCSYFGTVIGSQYMIFFTDDDECETGRNLCDVYAFCNNTVGSYNCSCGKGFNGTGFICEGKQTINRFEKII